MCLSVLLFIQTQRFSCFALFYLPNLPPHGFHATRLLPLPLIPRKTAILHSVFNQSIETLLPSNGYQFDSNKLIQILYRFGHFSYQQFHKWFNAYNKSPSTNQARADPGLCWRALPDTLGWQEVMAALEEPRHTVSSWQGYVLISQLGRASPNQEELGATQRAAGVKKSKTEGWYLTVNC